MKNSKWISIFGSLALAATVGDGRAAQTNFSAGQAQLPWLKIVADARTAAMGGAGRGIARGVNAVVQNPAGLARLSGGQVSVQRNIGIAGTSMDHAAGAGSVGRRLGVGFGLDLFSYGEVETYRVEGGSLAQGNSIEPGGHSLSAGAGLDLGAGFAAGATLKLVSEELGFGPRALGMVSAGAEWTGFGGLLSLGSAIQNLGLGVEGDMPVNVVAGISSAAALGNGNQVVLAVDANMTPYAAETSSVSAGAEWRGLGNLAVRAGYRAAQNLGLGGPTLGFGASFSRIVMDYAYVVEGEMGASHQMALSLTF